MVLTRLPHFGEVRPLSDHSYSDPTSPSTSVGHSSQKRIQQVLLGLKSSLSSPTSPQDVGLQLHILDLPNEIIEKIFSYLPYKKIGEIRLACKRFDQIGSSILNTTFQRLQTQMLIRLQTIKGQMPRRLSARRTHPLARESDIVKSLHSRLLLLQISIGKHTVRKHCCFFAGDILDEVYRILAYIKSTPNLDQEYIVTGELFDLSTMAMEYFQEHIEPRLPKITFFDSKFVGVTSRFSEECSVRSPSGSGRSSEPEDKMPEHEALPRSNMVLRKRIKRIRQRRRNAQFPAMRRELKSCKGKLADQHKQVLEYTTRMDEYDKKFEESSRKFSTVLQIVRCQETGCTAVLQQPCGHEVCHSHSACAVQVGDLVVWHPDGCEICYALYKLVTDVSSSRAIRASSLSTLKTWVGGFGRNVASGRPYVLSEEICNLLYPNAWISAAVPKDVAAPLIAWIRYETQTPQDENLCEEVAEEVAAINIDVEPMSVDDHQVEGRVVSEAGEGGRSRSILFSSPSSSSSFQGFSKSANLGDRSRSVIPKVKSLKKKDLPKRSRSQRSNPPAPSRLSLAPKPVTSSSKATPPSKGSRTRVSKAKPPQPSFDSEAFADLLVQKISSKFETLVYGPFSQFVTSLETLRQSVLSLAQRIKAQESRLAGFIQSKAAQQSHGVPDTSRLPPFDKRNPWRLALHAPLHNGTLTIEGLGTRRLEELEFFPANLVPPYPGFARLTEESWIRSDKVPKETVIFPRDQAQSILMRALTDWGCENTNLTPFGGSFPMFSLGDSIPTPCTTKIAELTHQAVMDGKPIPQLRETDPTSLLFPGDSEFWLGAPATFTVGKLDPECASTLFGEQLPKIPDALLKKEYEARCRLSRSIHSITISEVTALVYADEPLFQVLTKSLLASFQSDLYDYVVARQNCRKHIFANATIRHEPNRLIKSSIWGPNLFPEDEVNNVLAEATRANQSLRSRWGLPFKRKSSETSGPQPKGRKRFRRFQGYQKPQAQTVLQAVPVWQIGQPSTSEAQPQQQYVLVQQA
ncbi:uncharacterized protein [Macrobrachium rosenbergii]|uniref:uncharacterized protein isoform X2 n=1 Tax=Macrobrachium rosenbergii TaxID=79674 RepID=UPI0034D53504